MDGIPSLEKSAQELSFPDFVDEQQTQNGLQTWIGLVFNDQLTNPGQVDQGTDVDGEIGYGHCGQPAFIEYDPANNGWHSAMGTEAQIDTKSRGKHEGKCPFTMMDIEPLIDDEDNCFTVIEEEMSHQQDQADTERVLEHFESELCPCLGAVSRVVIV